MNPFEISVLVCTKNRPRFLKLALYSLAMQTFTGKFEVLVLDDSDETQRMENCQHCLNFGLRPNISMKHIALASGAFSITEKLNLGNTMAQADLIFQADDDDFHFPRRLDIQAGSLKKGNDFCHCGHPLWAYATRPEIYQLVSSGHPGGIMQGSTFAYWNGVYKKFGGFPTPVQKTHDKLFADFLVKNKVQCADCTEAGPIQLAFEHSGNYWSSPTRLDGENFKKIEKTVPELMSAEAFDLLLDAVNRQWNPGQQK